MKIRGHSKKILKGFFWLYTSSHIEATNEGIALFVSNTEHRNKKLLRLNLGLC